ncbi:MAG: hypothetical protein WC306_01540 [Candidatus Paceibacterota bacterium]|jgi:hypothetical protein
MNIKRKYIIIFGTLILLLVIIIGAIAYYKEKVVQISDVKQSVPIFSRNYPDSLNRLKDFIGFCNSGVFSNIEGLKGKKIKEVVCTLELETRKIISKEKILLVSGSAYIPSFSSLDSITSFKSNKYIGISVDLKDVIREYDPSLLEKDKLYLCSISEPSWVDPFYLQMEPKSDLIFDNGDVSCGGIKMDKIPFMNFSGFIPQAEFLIIKQYLVDEQTVSNVMSKQSFSEIKDILKDYPIIWQMEKPITP